MSQKSTIDLSEAALTLLHEELRAVAGAQMVANHVARKANRMAKKQYQLSLLEYEQRERQYLIEKSALQPTFKVSATEVLVCEPDFVNDPEQASEASFVLANDVGIDHRVLRIRIDAKGDAEYRRPCLFYSINPEQQSNGLAYAFSTNTYFVALEGHNNDVHINSVVIYFVYKDKTTLPVIHQYVLTKDDVSALQRWQVSHQDTVYTTTHSLSLVFDSVSVCESLFTKKNKAS